MFLSYSHCGSCIWYISFSLLFARKLSGKFVACPNMQNFKACSLSWFISSFLLLPFLCLVFTVRASYCLFRLVCAHVSVFKSFVEKGMRSHPEASFLPFVVMLTVCHSAAQQARGGDSAGCCLHAVSTSFALSPRVSSLPFPILFVVNMGILNAFFAR